MDLLLGLITGILFGFLLQKAEVLRFEKQVGFLLLRDFTILRFLGAAVLTGMVGIQLGQALGWFPADIKTTVLGAQVTGGLLFGAGWAIAGYCPGTSLGALGEGRWHAIWVILGMVFGAGVYAELYPALEGNLLAWGSYGKLTLPGLMGLPPWLVAAGFIVLGILCFRWLDRDKH